MAKIVKTVDMDILDKKRESRGSAYMDLHNSLDSQVTSACDDILHAYVSLGPSALRIIDSGTTDFLAKYVGKADLGVRNCPDEANQVNVYVENVQKYLVKFPPKDFDGFPTTKNSGRVYDSIKATGNERLMAGLVVKNGGKMNIKYEDLLKVISSDDTFKDLLPLFLDQPLVIDGLNQWISFVKFLNKQDFSTEPKMKRLYAAAVHFVSRQLSTCTSTTNESGLIAALYFIPEYFTDNHISIALFNAVLKFLSSPCGTTRRAAFWLAMQSYTYSPGKTPSIGIVAAAFASDNKEALPKLVLAARLAIKYGASEFLNPISLITILNNSRGLGIDSALTVEIKEVDEFKDLPKLKAVRTAPLIPISNVRPPNLDPIDVDLLQDLATTGTFDTTYIITHEAVPTEGKKTYQWKEIYPRMKIELRTGKYSYRLCRRVTKVEVALIKESEVKEIEMSCFDEMTEEVIQHLFKTNPTWLAHVIRPWSAQALTLLGSDLIIKLTPAQYATMADSWAYNDPQHPYRALFQSSMLIDSINRAGMGNLIEAEAYLMSGKYWIKAFENGRQVSESVAVKILANVTWDDFREGLELGLTYDIQPELWIALGVAVPKVDNPCVNLDYASHPFLEKTSLVCKTYAKVWPRPAAPRTYVSSIPAEVEKPPEYAGRIFWHRYEHTKKQKQVIPPQVQAPQEKAPPKSKIPEPSKGLWYTTPMPTISAPPILIKTPTYIAVPAATAPASERGPSVEEGVPNPIIFIESDPVLKSAVFPTLGEDIVKLAWMKIKKWLRL